MFLLLSSFLAGMLTSLAPCMITLLPVIVGNSLVPDGDKKLDRKKPYVIAASLAVSVIIFTIILKSIDCTDWGRPQSMAIYLWRYRRGTWNKYVVS